MIQQKFDKELADELIAARVYFGIRITNPLLTHEEHRRLVNDLMSSYVSAKMNLIDIKKKSETMDTEPISRSQMKTLLCAFSDHRFMQDMLLHLSSTEAEGLIRQIHAFYCDRDAVPGFIRKR